MDNDMHLLLKKSGKMVREWFLEQSSCVMVLLTALCVLNTTTVVLHAVKEEKMLCRFVLSQSFGVYI
jgi:hypothetical protein